MYADIQQELQGLTYLASTICNTPISLINLLDKHRQITKSATGWDLKEVPREESFCHHTLMEGDMMVIENMEEDPRFNTSELVTSDTHIRFYAGVPLTNSDGHALGAICVMDREPRNLTAEQEQSLKSIAKEAVARLELLKKRNELQERNEALERAAVFLDNSSDIQVIIEPSTLKVVDVFGRTSQILGIGRNELLNETFGIKIKNQQVRNTVREFLSQDDKIKDTFVFEVDRGSDRTVFLEATFTLNNGFWFATAKDITRPYLTKKKLSDTLKKLQEAQKLAKLSSWEFELDTGEMTWSKESYRLYEYDPDETDATLSNYLARVHPDDREDVVQVIESVKTGDRPRSMRHRIVTPEEGVKHLLVRAESYEEEAGGTTIIRGTTQDITELAEAELRLRSSLQEKEIMLAEIHHRVKNNLAVISSLLQLEAFSTEEEQVHEALASSQRRVHSIAKVHEKLYESGDFTNLPFNTYVREITDTLKIMLGNRQKDIVLEHKSDEVELNVNQAIPMGLILNELISNSLEHAFEGREEGTIKVSLRKGEGEVILLEVSDDGKGLPESIDPHVPDTVGFSLVQTLCRQLKGDFEIVESTAGTHFRIRFKKAAVKGAGSSFFVK